MLYMLSIAAPFLYFENIKILYFYHSTINTFGKLRDRIKLFQGRTRIAQTWRINFGREKAK